MSEILCNRHHLENYVILYVAVYYIQASSCERREFEKEQKKKKKTRR